MSRRPRLQTLCHYLRARSSADAQDEIAALSQEIAEAKRKSVEATTRLAEERQAESGALQGALAKSQAQVHDLQAELSRAKVVQQEVDRAHEAEVAELMNKVRGLLRIHIGTDPLDMLETRVYTAVYLCCPCITTSWL